MVVLFCKVFVVQVQLVVFYQFVVQYIGIIDDIVRDFSVGKYQCYGIILGLNFVVGVEIYIWGVNGNFGCFFQFYGIYVDFWIGNFFEDVVEFGVGNDFKVNVVGKVFVFESLCVWKSKGFVLVIEQLLGFDFVFQDEISYFVSFQVIVLFFVYGQQYIGGLCLLNNQDEKGKK